MIIYYHFFREERKEDTERLSLQGEAKKEPEVMYLGEAFHVTLYLFILRTDASF